MKRERREEIARLIYNNDSIHDIMNGTRYSIFNPKMARNKKKISQALLSAIGYHGDVDYLNNSNVIGKFLVNEVEECDFILNNTTFGYKEANAIGDYYSYVDCSLLNKNEIVAFGNVSAKKFYYNKRYEEFYPISMFSHPRMKDLKRLGFSVTSKVDRDTGFVDHYIFSCNERRVCARLYPKDGTIECRYNRANFYGCSSLFTMGLKEDDGNVIVVMLFNRSNRILAFDRWQTVCLDWQRDIIDKEVRDGDKEEHQGS